MELRQRHDRLPPKSPERAVQMATVAQLYGVYATTVYRSLHRILRPRTAHRRAHGNPRVKPHPGLRHYFGLSEALKLRTTNKSVRALQLMEDYCVGKAQVLACLPFTFFIDLI